MLDVSLSMMSKETGKNLLQHRDMMSKGMCGCEGERAYLFLFLLLVGLSRFILAFLGHKQLMFCMINSKIISTKVFGMSSIPPKR